MKTIRKALLATAVATALSPAAVMADTTLFGNFDISVGFESGAEEALAIEGAGNTGDNVIGIEGSLDLENGNAVTYQYVMDLNIDGGAALNANYHSYIGYKTDSMEVRAGNQDLPLRIALDKADQFAGTYADQNNVIGGQNGGAPFGAGNTTANNSIMLLGGNDTVAYAVSADTSIETANTKDSTDGIRFGAMADFAINESTSVALGVESLTDAYSSIGLSANIGISDSAELSLAVNSYSEDGVGTDSTEAIIGAAFGISDMTTLKAQVGTSDIDGVNDNATYFAVGADFALADNVTTYVLAASGTDGGLITTGTAANDRDADGDASVLAGGIKLSF